MSKLKKTVTDTPDVPILQKVFGKTIEYFEIAAVVVVVLIIAGMLGG